MGSTYRLVSDDDEFEVEEVFEREIKSCGKKSAHVLLPAKFVGYWAKVLVQPLTGQWAAGYARNARALEREAERAAKRRKKR